MRCIYCAGKKTAVINSRAIGRGYMTWRRRSCPACVRVFTTKESPVADNLFLVKRNGSRQRFFYEKLFASVFTILNSGKRRDSGEAALRAKKLAGRVVEQLFRNAEKKDVTTKKVIELVYKELKRMGQAYADAYISYSEYRAKVLLQAGLIRVPEMYR